MDVALTAAPPDPTSPVIPFEDVDLITKRTPPGSPSSFYLQNKREKAIDERKKMSRK